MLDMMEEELRAHRDDYAAVGEVGLDLHWPDSPALAERQRTFERQLGWGVKYGLPVIIHSRDARDETLESIVRVRQASGKLPVMIFHSFTGTPEDVTEIRKVCDPYFGVNGVVQECPEAARGIAADRHGPAGAGNRRAVSRSGAAPWRTERVGIHTADTRRLRQGAGHPARQAGGSDRPQRRLDF